MIARFLFHNPRILVVLIAIIGVAGLSSYLVLPRMEDPVLTRRVGVINTALPGAEVGRVESLVTRRIEDRVRSVAGIEQVHSTSRAGHSSIQIELSDHVDDVEDTWSLIRDQLSDVRSVLPREASKPEFRRPKMKASAVIAALRWEGPGEPDFSLLGRFAEELKDEIRAVPGTESVETFGGPEERVLVELEPERLAGLGLTVAEVARFIEACQSYIAAGSYRDSRSDLLVAGGGGDTLDDLRETPLPVGERGETVNLADLATIRRGIQDPPPSRALVDGRPAVVVSAWVRDTHRIDFWTADLEAALVHFSGRLPRSVALDTVFAQNEYVASRLDQLLRNLCLAMVVVVVVVFFMMGWRSMLVVALVLPLSALIVLTGMRWLGIPIHQMSITGLIIALGLLIDNAIIIVDDVRSRLWSGSAPAEAIVQGIAHLALPLFGSTLTTALAFAPIVILPGSVGEFVGSVAISVILAIGGSFFLAMTVVPALTVLFNPPSLDRPGFWQVGLGGERMGKIYRWSLIILFRNPLVGVFAGLALPVFGLLQMRNLPEQFFPPVKRDQIAGDLEVPALSSIDRTTEVAAAVRERAMARDEVENIHWFIGGSAPSFYYNLMPARRNSPTYAQGFVALKPGVDSREVIRKLQADLDPVFPQSRIVVRQLEQGPPIDAPVELRIYGPDPAVLQRLGREVRRQLASIPEVVHTRADLEEAVPVVEVRLDENEASLTGLNRQEIARQLYLALEGIEAGRVMEENEELPVLVRLAPEVRGDLDRIASMEIKPLTPGGRSAEGPTLDAVGTLELDSQVAAITRIDGRRVNAVKAYLVAGTLPSTVNGALQEAMAAADITPPEGYRFEFAGESAERDEAVRNLMADITLLVSLIIAALVCSFQSFRVSAIIASVGGLSIGLGLASLWTFGFPFGFMAILGIMGLVGIAINDAIVVMAGIREDLGAAVGDVEAIARVVMQRTRHVLTTSVTTMAGFTPLVLGGGEFWPPVAIAIAGGVAGATILALYFVPSLFLLIVCRRWFWFLF